MEKVAILTQRYKPFLWIDEDEDINHKVNAIIFKPDFSRTMNLKGISIKKSNS